MKRTLSCPLAPVTSLPRLSQGASSTPMARSECTACDVAESGTARIYVLRVVGSNPTVNGPSVISARRDLKCGEACGAQREGHTHGRAPSRFSVTVTAPRCTAVALPTSQRPEGMAYLAGIRTDTERGGRATPKQPNNTAQREGSRETAACKSGPVPRRNIARGRNGVQQSDPDPSRCHIPPRPTHVSSGRQESADACGDGVKHSLPRRIARLCTPMAETAQRDDSPFPAVRARPHERHSGGETAS